MDDVWLHVFTYLRPIELLECRHVSSEWDHLVNKTFKTRQVIDAELHFPGFLDDSRTMAAVVAMHGSSLREAIFRVKAKTERYAICSSEYHVTTDIVRTLTRIAPRLRSLRFERVILTVGAIQQLANLPETLEELSIVNCQISCDSIDLNPIIQSTFAAVFQKCQNLQEFDILGRGYCHGYFSLTSQVLHHLKQSVKRLSIAPGSGYEIKDLQFLDGLRLETLLLQRSLISSVDLAYLCPMVSSLRTLDLTSSINITDYKEIGHLTELRELNLSCCRDGLGDDSLISITNGCRFLEGLCIENCSQLTRNSLVYLGNFRHLKWLKASGLSALDDNVAMALSSCAALEYLDVQFCSKLNPAGIQLLLELPNLSEINLVGVKLFSSEILIRCRRIPCTISSDNHELRIPIVVPPLPTLGPVRA